MASRLTTLIVVLIVGGTLIAGFIVGAQREDLNGPIDLIVTNGRIYSGTDGKLVEALADSRQQDSARRLEPRRETTAPGADDDGGRARRRGAARVQRQPYPPALGRARHFRSWTWQAQRRSTL